MDFSGGSGRQQLLPPPMTPLPLARQGSVYSLTFDEFQSTLGGAGKDFGSMNMDELLRSIWTAEELHVVGADATTSLAAAPTEHAVGPPGQRQGSLTLPRTLSQKTVDEVWRDMMCFGGADPVPVAAEPPPPVQRQQTLGEITLEEFLVRAGVVREGMSGPSVPPPPARVGVSPRPPPPPPQPPVLFAQSNVFSPMVPPLSLGNGLVSAAIGQVGGGGAAPLVPPVRPVTSNGYGKMEGEDLSSLSPPSVPYVLNGGMRGRKASGIEKVVERRQRRMIKNRESAARSRERKQTYMMELQAEVAKLKELNEELQKKQEVMLEQQKNEVLERITRQVGPTAKRICLRRTLTGPW
ncbi:hypothetical protein GUJ93_ZPchr0006g44974 [Zizania palustris]|uniref:BZIP domain-containing protein n=1 Tax=Zizania palustris TaxID=103762 RepID=A0A8J5VVB0_ZIZPA|nr:hypothetical protein GUJ93_ZPchr0006g44974 [Zizania palustris]